MGHVIITGIRNLIQRRAKERQLQLEKSLINENSPSSNGKRIHSSLIKIMLKILTEL
jgi:hypothetical protein